MVGTLLKSEIIECQLSKIDLILEKKDRQLAGPLRRKWLVFKGDSL